MVSLLSLRELLRPAPECPNPWSPRVVFQWNVLLRARGEVLNVGCSDDPLGFGDRCVHFDLDKWDCHERFVQGDAHSLSKYFERNSFDTVILGGVVEHLVDPEVAILEAVKVAKRVVALDVWEEWRGPDGEGPHIEWAQEGLLEVARGAGYDSYEEYSRATEGCEVYPEAEIPHRAHLWKFTDSSVAQLLISVLGKSGWSMPVFAKVPEVEHEGHQVQQWLVVLEAP